MHTSSDAIPEVITLSRDQARKINLNISDGKYGNVKKMYIFTTIIREYVSCCLSWANSKPNQQNCLFVLVRLILAPLDDIPTPQT